MNECKPISTPLEPGLQLTKNTNLERINQPYRELIGSIMYIMLGSRPDLCYTIGYLSRFQDLPSQEHWVNLKRVLRYLQSTKHLKLMYSRNESDVPVIGYVDSDWGSDAIDRKSVTGWIFKVFGATVSWCSRKQKTIALSSTEAEYIAACDAAVEAIWLKGLLNDLQINVGVVKINEDNQGCIAMSKNCENKRVKHIDIKYHFLREKIGDGSIMLEYIETENQLADICTIKSLPKPEFEKHRSRMQLN